jgi:hypothetical protein
VSVFSCFWYELVEQGHRTTIDVLATYPAIGALALLYSSRSRFAIFSFGALAGLAIILRFQLSPMIAALGVLSFMRWGWKAWPAAIAVCVVVAAGGVLDYYTWGVWFSSIVTNLQINLLHGVASEMGVKPFYWYVWVIIVLSGGLAAVGGIGLLSSRRSSWPLIVVGTVTLLSFSAIAHKEARFVFTLVPLWLIGVATVTADHGLLLAQRAPRLAALAPTASRILTLSVFAISFFGLFRLLPYQHNIVPAAFERNYTREAYRSLALQGDVEAVLDLSGVGYGRLAPYYDLHHNVPLYRGASYSIPGFDAAVADPQIYASHVLLKTGASEPQGFRRLKTVGDIAIWRRVMDPASTPIAPGYQGRLETPQHLNGVLNVVSPRWFSSNRQSHAPGS